MMITLQKTAFQRTVLAAVALLCWVETGTVLAQTVSTSGSPDPQEQFATQQAFPAVPPASLSLDPTSEAVPLSEDATQSATPNCPAGQLASAFPDVLPNHWAFTAVNRLAATPARCFLVSPQS